MGALQKMQKGYADGGYVGPMSAGGGYGSSGGGTVVNVNDQRSGGAPVQTKTSQGADGKTQIDILVRDSMNRQISNGSFDTLMGSTYGVGRSGTPR